MGNTPLLLSQHSVSSTEVFPHTGIKVAVKVAVKDNNKRCAKLIDGNNGKRFLVTVVMKRRNHFNLTTNSKKLKRHMYSSLSNVFMCVCAVCTDVWDD